MKRALRVCMTRKHQRERRTKGSYEEQGDLAPAQIDREPKSETKERSSGHKNERFGTRTSPSLTTSPHAAPDELIIYAGLCGWTLARAHAPSGDRVQIAGYLGKSERFDRAVADCAEAYADQTERYHAALCTAVKSGRIPADAGAWENQRRRR